MWLTVVSSVLTLLVGLYRTFWSDAARLKSLELKLAAVKERQAVEAERLEATYARIDREAPKTGETLANDLNKKFPSPRE